MVFPFLVASAAARQPREIARDIIIARFGFQPLSDRLLLGISRSRDERVGHIGRRNACRTIEDECRADVRFIEQQIGLQQLQLEADRPKVIPKQELTVLERELVGAALRLWDRGDMFGRLRIDF